MLMHNPLVKNALKIKFSFETPCRNKKEDKAICFKDLNMLYSCFKFGGISIGHNPRHHMRTAILAKPWR